MNRHFQLDKPPLLSLQGLFSIAGCNSKAESSVAVAQEKTTALPEQQHQVMAISVPLWEEMLRQTIGWIGADGVYSVALNGVETPGKANEETETMFWFSDSINGEIGKLFFRKAGKMDHNLVGFMQVNGPNLLIIKFGWWEGEQGETVSMFEPAILTYTGR